MSLPLRLLICLAVLLVQPKTGSGAETVLAEGYSIQVWRTEDGLPQNTVTSLVQTRDGFLWFGTQGGLARFDGERFVTFDARNTPGMQDRRISALFEDPDGTLWIGQETGSLLTFKDGRFQRVPVKSESSFDKIVALGSDESGRLWTLRVSGVLESPDGTEIPSSLGEGQTNILAWTRNRTGKIWIYQNGRAASFEKARMTEMNFDPPKLYAHVGAIAASAGKGVWVLKDDRIRKWTAEGWTDDRGYYPWEPDMISCCLELHDGTLAVGTVRMGLYFVYRDGRPAVHLNQKKGLPQDWIRFLYEDREGTLWAGTGSAGVAAIHSSAFSVLNPPDLWKGASVIAVAPGSGDSIWAGTEGAGLYHFSKGLWKTYGQPEGLDNMYIWAVCETSDGHVWAGNYWKGGPYQLRPGGFERPATVDPQSSAVLALLPEKNGKGIFIGRRDGLQLLDERGETWLIRAGDLGVSDVSSLVQDSTGKVWCGFARGGLVQVDQGKVSLLGRKDGLGSEAIQCLYGDEDGALWIGTADNGLMRLKAGKFTHIGMPQGLLDQTICSIQDDGMGFFWLSSLHGLQRIEKLSLDQCAEGLRPAISSQKFDSSDGLPLNQFAGDRQGAGCRTADGTLWFPCSKGVVSVSPSRIHRNEIPAPNVITGMFVDGQTLQFENRSSLLELLPGHQRLEFQYAGLSFVAPSKVRFKYRLDGIDASWIDAGGKRSAFYSQLPAGTYRFRVMASNNDGLWNEDEATLEFSVQPFFWNTWWFACTLLLVIVTSVSLVVRIITRRRMQRRLTKLEQQRELERERTRIARDIHDDIGTSLARIAMFSQPDRVELSQPTQIASVMTRIYVTARDMTQALDEIVWAIDPQHDTLDSMVGYMGVYAQESLDAVGIRCRLEIPLHIPAMPLTADVRHNAFLAYKEILNNIAKHAAASEVQIRLNLEAEHFVLSISDNGRGFDRSTLVSENTSHRFGNGLKNIESRISAIGGICKISSLPGKGTQVSLFIRISATKDTAHESRT